ncbi:MAG: hypothetical protein ACYC3L_02920 [Gemmatimonadaceae bacterium]
MLALPRRAALVVLAALVSSVACKDASENSDIEVRAAASQLPPFQQEIASQKAELTLPGSWKYGYKMADKPDTTAGAFHAVEFYYSDSVSKVPPSMLLVIRAYKQAAWDKIAGGQKNISTKLAEHAGTVYAFSIRTSNPYPLNTAAALRVDAMMTDLTGAASPFKLEFP